MLHWPIQCISTYLTCVMIGGLNNNKQKQKQKIERKSHGWLIYSIVREKNT